MKKVVDCSLFDLCPGAITRSLHYKDNSPEVGAHIGGIALAFAALLISFLEVSGNKVAGGFENNTMLLIR